MIVMKFGGTSFASLAAWERVLSIVKSRKERNPVIVLSAVRGVTDDLAACADFVANTNRREGQNLFERIASTHFDICEQLQLGKEVRQQLGMMLRELKAALDSVFTLRELTPRTRDQIVAYGEQLCSTLLTCFLRKYDVPAEPIDSRKILTTNERYSAAVPRGFLSRQRTRERILPLLGNGKIPVLAGFIGGTTSGQTTTIGRGGSDYSASLFAGWLQAEEVEIWKDVPGFMTADPRVVPEAETIPVLSYQQAEQLCRYGAKILHPLSVRAAARKRIPIRVLHTENPDQPGTLIYKDPDPPIPGFVAIAAQKQTGRLIVVGHKLRHPAFAAQVLGSCRGLQILKISQDMLRSRMIVVTAHGEDTDRAIRQIHAEIFNRKTQTAEWA
jgi:aspartate kinase